MGTKKRGTLRLSEKVLGALAMVILLGWLIGLTPGGNSTAGVGPGHWWFVVLSLLGAIVVVALIVIKWNCLELLPANVRERLLPIASLFPVVGFLVKELNSVQSILTVGGSIALAYISATSYLRSYIPGFVMNPLGDSDEEAAVETKEAERSDEAAAEKPKPESKPAEVPEAEVQKAEVVVKTEEPYKATAPAVEPGLLEESGEGK